jgi:hypothetical protein
MSARIYSTWFDRSPGVTSHAWTSYGVHQGWIYVVRRQWQPSARLLSMLLCIEAVS